MRTAHRLSDLASTHCNTPQQTATHRNTLQQGAMRTAHRLYDLAATGPDSVFVVKFSKDPKESPQRFFDDVEMQMEVSVLQGVAVCCSVL